MPALRIFLESVDTIMIYVWSICPHDLLCHYMSDHFPGTEDIAVNETDEAPAAMRCEFWYGESEQCKRTFLTRAFKAINTVMYPVLLGAEGKDHISDEILRKATKVTSDFWSERWQQRTFAKKQLKRQQQVLMHWRRSKVGRDGVTKTES